MGISRYDWTSQGSDWRASLEHYRALGQCPTCVPFPSEIFIPCRKHLLPQKWVYFLELPVQTLPKQSEAVSRHTGSIFPTETLLKSQPHLATLNMESPALKQHWHNIQLPISISQLPCSWILRRSRGWIRDSHSVLPQGMLDVHPTNNATVPCVLFVKDIEKSPVNWKSEAHCYPAFCITVTSGEIFPKWISQCRNHPKQPPTHKSWSRLGFKH